jgi:hypothetical protein
MTTAIAEAFHKAQRAPGSPEDITYKVASRAVAGILTGSEDGVVEALVSVTGIPDEVDDVIVPGAYVPSLKVRTPKGVWSHDWDVWVSRTEGIAELMPGDGRIPELDRRGNPWPAEAGALWVKTRFNLGTVAGRDAYSNVLFFGDEVEWCVDEDTEILTARGWLRYDQLTTDDHAYALDTETLTSRFEPVQAVNVWPAKQRTLRHIETGGFSSLTTAAHRWPTVQVRDRHGAVRWRTTEQLRAWDSLFRCAPHFEAPTEAKWSDGLVELVAWVWCEGWRAADTLFIGQSHAVNPEKVGAIRRALATTFPGAWSDGTADGGMTRFRLHKAAAAVIEGCIGPDKEPTPEFLLALTPAQLRLLVERCLDGDGTRTPSGQRTWSQVAQAGVDAFQMACALGGIPTQTHPGKDYGNRFGRAPQTVGLLRKGVTAPLASIATKSYGYKPGPAKTPAIDQLVTHEGIVWCPTTPSGTWLARRNGSVYFTGNSVGYNVPSGKSRKVNGKRLIYYMDTFEYCPVLFGAAPLSGTVALGERKRRAGEQTLDVQLALEGKNLADNLDLEGKSKTGVDTHPVGAERLAEYWEHGEGAAKIAWGTDGDLMRCVDLVVEHAHMTPEKAKGYCFAGETEILTRDGIVSLGESAGTDVWVLTAPDPTGPHSQPVRRDGRWVQAEVHDFGEQPVLSVTLRRGKQRQTIRATAEHTWFASPDSKSRRRLAVQAVQTADLRPGMSLAALLPKAPTSDRVVSPFGVAAGAVFGDGHTVPGQGAQIDLWGDKDAELLRYFDGCSQSPRKTSNGVPGVRVRGIPASFKAAPRMDEGAAYLLGWLAGYVAADGTVSELGVVSLSSARHENLLLAKKIADRLGIATGQIGTRQRVGLGDVPTDLHKMTFLTATVPPQMLVLSEHRRRFDAARARAGKETLPVRWVVESVEDLGEVERVYCAVVPDTETFALADYLWVHNCALRHRGATGGWPGHAPAEEAEAAAKKGSKIMGTETETNDTGTTIEVKAYGVIPGSREALDEALRGALEDALLPEPVESEGGMTSRQGYLSIDGTFPDHVICTVTDYSDGDNDKQSWSVPYTITGDVDGDDDDVTLGEPSPVELQIVVLPDVDRAADDDDEQVPPEVVDGANLAMKTLGVFLGTLEAKAVSAVPIDDDSGGKDAQDGPPQPNPVAGHLIRRLRLAHAHLGSALASMGVSPNPVTIGTDAKQHPAAGADEDDVELLLTRAAALNI